MNSTEVRWFLPGKRPTALYDQLVAALTAPIDSETREDWYLYSPQTSDLSIKLREGSLEIKQRQQQNEMSWTPDVQGYIEEWMKWSFPIDAADHRNPDSPTNLILNSQSQSWINVHKTRWSWYYSVRVGSIALVETIDPNNSACSLELSELQINNQSWHSLCFEAIGPADTSEILNQTVQQVAQSIVQFSSVQSQELPHLTQQNSYGYPAWLKQVQQQVQQNQGQVI